MSNSNQDTPNNIIEDRLTSAILQPQAVEAINNLITDEAMEQLDLAVKKLKEAVAYQERLLSVYGLTSKQALMLKCAEIAGKDAVGASLGAIQGIYMLILNPEMQLQPGE